MEKAAIDRSVDGKNRCDLKFDQISLLILRVVV